MSDLDALRFDDAVPPEFPDETPPVITGPKDVAPETDSLACLECGKPLTYAGRGRKPKYCDDHKKSGGGKASGTRVVRATGNERLAEQATTALVQINRLTGFGARVIGMTQTAEMIAFTEEGFREQAFEALKTDPALCKQILSAGEVSGKFSLAVAYMMMGAQIAPVAAMEIKAKREAKREAQESADAS